MAKLNLIISLLQRIIAASGFNILGSNNTFTGTNTFTNVNDFSTSSGDVKVRDVPTTTHTAINQTLGDTRYYRSYGVAANYNITGLTTLDISLITNFANCNQVTLTSSNANETINNITNLPSGVAWKIIPNTGLTVLFAEKAGGTGNIRNPDAGATPFNPNGSNGNFGIFQTGVLANTVQRIGGAIGYQA